MKKFLGILFIGLLFCGDSFAGKVVNLPKDVASGNKYFKSKGCGFSGLLLSNQVCPFTEGCI